MQKQFEEAQQNFQQRQSAFISYLLSKIHSQTKGKEISRKGESKSKARTTIFEFADDSDSDANNSPALRADQERKTNKSLHIRSEENSIYSEIPRDDRQKQLLDLLDKERVRLMRYQLDLKKCKSQMDQNQRQTMMLIRELKRYGQENIALKEEINSLKQAQEARPQPEVLQKAETDSKSIQTDQAQPQAQKPLPTKKINLKKQSIGGGAAVLGERRSSKNVNQELVHETENRGRKQRLESEDKQSMKEEDESELNISQQLSSAAQVPPHSIPKAVSVDVSVGAHPQISQYRKGAVGTPNRTSFSTQEPRTDPLRSQSNSTTPHRDLNEILYAFVENTDPYQSPSFAPATTPQMNGRSLSSPSFQGARLPMALLKGPYIDEEAQDKGEDKRSRQVEKGRLRPLQAFGIGMNEGVVVEESQEMGEDSPLKHSHAPPPTSEKTAKFFKTDGGVVPSKDLTSEFLDDQAQKVADFQRPAFIYSTPNSIHSSPSKFFTNQSFAYRGKFGEPKRRKQSNSYQSSQTGDEHPVPFYTSLSTPQHMANTSYTSNEFWMKKVDTLIDQKRNYIKMNSETRKEILETQRENDLLRGLLKEQEKVIEELKDKKVEDNNSRIPTPSSKKDPTVSTLDLRRMEQQKKNSPPDTGTKSARNKIGGTKASNNNPALKKSIDKFNKTEKLRLKQPERKQQEVSPAIRSVAIGRGTSQAKTRGGLTRPKRKISSQRLSNTASVTASDQQQKNQSQAETGSQVSLISNPSQSGEPADPHTSIISTREPKIETEVTKLARPKSFWEQKPQNPTPRSQAAKNIKSGLRYKSPMSTISKSAPSDHKFPRHYGKSILEKYAAQEQKAAVEEMPLKEAVPEEAKEVKEVPPPKEIRSISREIVKDQRSSALASVQPSPQTKNYGTNSPRRKIGGGLSGIPSLSGKRVGGK